MWFIFIYARNIFFNILHFVWNLSKWKNELNLNRCTTPHVDFSSEWHLSDLIQKQNMGAFKSENTFGNII